MAESPQVFVLCPAARISGGPEALHQFAGALRAKGVDASMVYYPPATQGHAVPMPYRRYGVPVSALANNNAASVVVIPEVATSLVWRYPLARRAVWWLSIDNYFKWQHINPGVPVLDSTADILHLCQSHYAYDFLARRGVGPLLMLSDFLPENVFTAGPLAGRVPAVAYNTKRVSKPLQQLIAQGGGRIWLPLENMEQAVLAEVLQEVRLYVDFGPHPGRDRIPREAALSGAVVITGRQGSAGFAEDVSLPDRFRLDERAVDFQSEALKLIDELLYSDTAFRDASVQQDSYRKWIGQNKDIFMAEVDAFIGTITMAKSDEPKALSS